MAMAVLLGLASLMPVPLHAQAVYDITYSNVSGWTNSSCCSETDYRVAQGVNDVLSATFQDTSAAGIIQSIQVEVAIRHACENNSMIFAFNGQTLGTWGAADGPHCSCGNPEIGIATFTLTSPSTYNFGGTNTITITNVGTGFCHQAIGENLNWGDGVAMRVTVNGGRAAPSQVPTLPGMGLLALVLVLLIMGFLAIKKNLTAPARPR